MSRRFAIIPARALDDERITNADLRILCALGRETDKYGWCHVKQQTIADKLDCSRGHVNTRLKNLVACGMVEQHHQTLAGRGQGASKYRLLFDVIIPSEEDDDTPEADVTYDDSGGADVIPTITGGVITDITPKDTSRSSFPKNTVVISASERDFLREQLSEAAGNVLNPKSHKLLLCIEPAEWIGGKNPCCLERDVLPVIRALSQSRPAHSVSSWNYYRAAVFEARDARLHAEKNPEPKDLSHAKSRNQKSAGQRYSDSNDAAARAAIASFD